MRDIREKQSKPTQRDSVYKYTRHCCLLKLERGRKREMMAAVEREKAVVVVVVREYAAEKDSARAEAVERMCEVGPGGGASLFTDLLGDPVCRVRHSPAFLMLVAETSGPDKEIVGLIRGCIKTVTCGQKTYRRLATGDGGDKDDAVVELAAPVYTKAGYILGLRVSPCHRRMGIGMKLVQRMEGWFCSNGAEYAYMATDKDNEASIRLFTERCNYKKFRTPAILVQPVFAHRLPLSRRSTVIRLSPAEAETLYRRRFSTTEFFPRDIDAVLRNNLSLGTFLAFPADCPAAASWTGVGGFLADPPASWAILSVWDSKSVFHLEVRGAPLLWRSLAWTTRAVDRVLPWLRIPSIPNIFRPFGCYFLYGIGGEGPLSANFLRALCRYAHNLARAGGCGVVATEVAASEPLMAGIPHWRSLSSADVWCIKRLAEDYCDGAVGDWTKSPAGSSLFVDPREV